MAEPIAAACVTTQCKVACDVSMTPVRLTYSGIKPSFRNKKQKQQPLDHLYINFNAIDI